MAQTAFWDDHILSIENLKTYISTPTGLVYAVDGVSLSARKGKILGILGESGSGKSVAMKSVMGVMDVFPGTVEGCILFHDGDTVIDLTAPLPKTVRLEYKGDGTLWKISKDLKAWRRGIHKIYRTVWGRKISMIFQDPQTSLNPFWTVGEQLGEAIGMGSLNGKLSSAGRRDAAIQWLDDVKIKRPEKIVDAYPHELSGGMCQRVMIAMALATNPDLVIADEPTTGLDATVQAQIVGLLKRLQEENGTTIIVISHDIGMIARLADDIMVMYCGQVQEVGMKAHILDMNRDGKHPYTEALLSSLPSIHQLRSRKKLRAIEKEVPDLKNPPTGCRFHPRCDVYQRAATDGLEGTRLRLCSEELPPLVYQDKTCAQVRCWLYESGEERENGSPE